MGTAPVISYNFGAGNCDELKSLRKQCFVVIAITAVLMCALAEALAGPLALMFVGYDETLMEITEHAFLIYSFCFLFSGFAIFGSSFFTALNDGGVSALIAFLRTLVFQVTAVFVLPELIGLDGIWLSVVVAEIMAVIVTAVLIIAKRKKYGYQFVLHK